MIAYERTPSGHLVARGTVEVGAASRDVAVDLGPWPDGADDPGGPLGLAGTPVVGVDPGSPADLAAAGLRRAGRDVPHARVAADPDRFGLRLLLLVGEGADAILVEGGGAALLDLARSLGGRPIAAPPLDRPSDLTAWLEGLAYDLHVPIPSVEEPMRGAIREMLAPLALEARHHVVEVDPYPALSDAGVDPGAVTPGALAAAAAGVLAGRLAAANRRWRADAGV